LGSDMIQRLKGVVLPADYYKLYGAFIIMNFLYNFS